MNDIEQKALALLNEVAKERDLPERGTIHRDSDVFVEALCRAIEQHEAFRQEVSEFALGVREYMACCNVLGWQGECDNFIIIKPDLLVEVLEEIDAEYLNAPNDKTYANYVLAALEARGLEIRSKNDD